MSKEDATSFALHSFRKPRWWQFWKNPICNRVDVNPMCSLGTGHADESRVVVIFGNTWFDISRHVWTSNVEFLKKSKTTMDCLNKCADITQRTLTELKKMINTS